MAKVTVKSLVERSRKLVKLLEALSNADNASRTLARQAAFTQDPTDKGQELIANEVSVEVAALYVVAKQVGDWVGEVNTYQADMRTGRVSADGSLRRNPT